MIARLSAPLALAAVLAACLLPASAWASTIAVEDGVLVYTGEPGEVNETGIYPAYMPNYAAPIPEAVYVYTNDEMTAGTGCAQSVDASFPPFVSLAYMCNGVTEGVQASLGDGNDFVEIGAPEMLPATVDAGDGNDFVVTWDGPDTIVGGAGDDEVLGGHGDDKIDGGDGNDLLNGDYGAFADGDEVGEDIEGAGSDVLSGGAGDDRLQGNGGADTLDGGAGEDTALYRSRSQPVTASFDGQANDGQADEKDRIGADVEGVVTGPGDDTVRGGDGVETIATGSGKDTVDAGAGADIVDTGDGTDTIAARDGAADKLGCGDGADTATVDAADSVSSDCEQVDRPAGPSAPLSAPAPGTLVAPTGLELARIGAVRAGRRARLRLSGRLGLPAGADPRLCAGAAVTVRTTVRSGRRRATRTATAVLGADCRFTVSVPVALRRGSRVTATARFGGTSFIGPAASRAMKLRVRR